MKYLLKNIQLETGGGVNIPADNRLERMEEISQQRRGNAVTSAVNQRTQHRDEVVGRRGDTEAGKPTSQAGHTVGHSLYYLMMQRSQIRSKNMTPTPAGLIFGSQTIPGYNLRNWLMKEGDQQEGKWKDRGRSSRT